MQITIDNPYRLPKDFSVFFCWQDHLDKKMYRYLIRDALNNAISKLQSELPNSADCILRQDSDTIDRAGSVAIADTICKKIRESSAVVADVTPVLYNSDKNWFYPNPNVMAEVGYAAGKIGWGKIICLYNKCVCTPEQLPFDIRHRRTTSFQYDGKTKKKMH